MHPHILGVLAPRNHAARGAALVDSSIPRMPEVPAILYEDDDVLVAEKPSGVVVHPAYRHPDGTFWDALLRLFAARGLGRPHLLHRLDRDTSGLLCVPKRPAAHRVLERAIRGGRFQKRYLALVHGHPV